MNTESFVVKYNFYEIHWADDSGFGAILTQDAVGKTRTLVCSEDTLEDCLFMASSQAQYECQFTRVFTPVLVESRWLPRAASAYLKAANHLWTQLVSG